MFSVLRMESKAQGRFTAVYHGNAPYMGENVAMEGNWIEHARFGRQFDIQALQVLQPTSVAGIERFLASGAVKGVGPVTAARIVEAFGTDTLEIWEAIPSAWHRYAASAPKRLPLSVNRTASFPVCAS